MQRDGFKSRAGFIIACIGSAVGMGNIWRFPIMVSQYGGLTFLIVYLIFVILISSSGMIEEFALGRWAEAGPVGAFGKCTEERLGSRKLGQAIGSLPIVGAMGLAIGYTIIMGWIFKYCFMGITGSLYGLGTDLSLIGATFGATAPEAETLKSAVNMMIEEGIFAIGNSAWQLVGLVVSLVIMARGISGGIEKANKLMMPVLFVIFLLLGVYIGFLPGAEVGYKYIFTLQPEGLLDPEVWVFAFGQAFFSLSVAGSGSVIYGSYLGKKEDIPGAARNVAIFDTLAAFLAAMVILPAMGVGGVAPDTAGPGLMFVYLVNVLNGMEGGRIVGMLFFICVLFAGATSIINLYEVPVAFLQEKLHTGRIFSVILVGGIGGIMSLFVQPWTSQWMDMVSIYICPLGAFLAGVMFFWVLDKKTALKAVHEGIRRPLGRWFYPLGKYVYCPLAIVALIAGVMFGGIG